MFDQARWKVQVSSPGQDFLWSEGPADPGNCQGPEGQRLSPVDAHGRLELDEERRQPGGVGAARLLAQVQHRAEDVRAHELRVDGERVAQKS